MKIYKKANPTTITICNDFDGFLQGYYDEDGYFNVEQLIVPPEKRGTGLSHELINKIPQKAKLLAQPLLNGKGPHITKEALIKLYEGHGFLLQKDKYGNNIMIRE